MVRLLMYLFRISGRMLAISIVASLMCAVANVLLMGLTVRSFQPDAAGSQAFTNFWLLCALLLATRVVSEIAIARLSHDNVYKLRVQLSRQIAAMRQKAIEDVGVAPVLAAMTDDIGNIMNVGSLFPPLAMGLCIAAGVLVYLLVLSPAVFGVVLLSMVVGVVIYQYLSSRAQPSFEKARSAHQAGIADVNVLLYGSKELRLNNPKHERALSDLEQHARIARWEGYKAFKWYSIGGSWASTVYFLLIGTFIAAASSGRFGIDRRSALATVFGILFMKGAVESVVGMLPLLRRAVVAANHIEAIGLKLEAGADLAKAIHHEDQPFERIDLTNIGYVYDGAAGQPGFRLGPISLDIRRGETIFIIGGNGAGKTSLLKLLCGLYAPTQGTIQLDGERIEANHLADYRQLFSAVFQDFYLLKKTQKLGNAESRARAEEYLEEFGLKDKVTLTADEFSCDELSRGQQKRLALILALLEDKPVCVLDEWAADQDSHFKAYFYSTILPRMKREGKTVIAVTHDDLYHHVADRVVLLREGTLAQTPAALPMMQENEIALGSGMA